MNAPNRQPDASLAAAPQASATTPAIELKGVGVARAERWILQNINWSVPSGACAAILGPNGSGKSTLARLLSGYIWPTVGEVWVDGQHFGETDLNELRQSIRLVQPAGPYDVDPELTSLEVVLTGLSGTIGLFETASQEQTEQAESLLARVGLRAVADHRYSTLSSGERVRALIARALVRRPKLLLLDEPTAGLDLLAREQVLATVQSLATADASHEPPTIVMITHHVEELAPSTSHVLLLREGEIAGNGSPAQVLTSETLSRTYRCPVQVHVEQGRYYVRVDPGEWIDLL